MPDLSPAQKKYLACVRREKYLIHVSRIFLFLGFLLLWEVSARQGWMDSFIFSSPSEIWRTFFKMVQDQSLFTHIRITLMETLVSFVFTVFLGIGTAVLLWCCPKLSRILEPYLVVLNSLPKSAMAPIFIVWLGNNMKTIIVTAISVAIFGSILNLFTSFMSTDPDKLKLIRTLHGSQADCLTKVILPMNLPTILSILKVDIGLCLIGVVIGEFLAAKEGLGYLIIYGSQVFKMDWVMLSIVLLCLIAALLYGVLNRLEKHFKNF